MKAAGPECWSLLSHPWGYRRMQGQPPSFFLGALGGLGGSSCSWYFLWEEAGESGSLELGTGTTGKVLCSPDSPHQLLEGFVHIEAQLGRGLKVGHVVGGAKGRGFRSGDLGGGQQEESGVCTQGGAQLWEGGRKTHYTL